MQEKQEQFDVFTVHLPAGIKVGEIGDYIEKELAATSFYGAVSGTGNTLQIMATKVLPKGLMLEEVTLKLGGSPWPFELSTKWAKIKE